MSNSESRTSPQALKALGLTLLTAAVPVVTYVPATYIDDLVFTFGQLPFINGELVHIGHVGAEITAEEAKEAVCTCALNALAAIDVEVGLDNVTRIVKVVGFVSSTAGFIGQLDAINKASELLGDVLGERSQHARSAVDMGQSPLDAPVEVEIIVEVAQ